MRALYRELPRLAVESSLLSDGPLTASYESNLTPRSFARGLTSYGCYWPGAGAFAHLVEVAFPTQSLERLERPGLLADSNQQPQTLFNRGTRYGYAVTLAQPDFG